jgi:hypothetical protein
MMVELVMVVQLYDHNVLDNTVRRFDHFDLCQLSLMMYNEYHNEVNQELWNYGANLVEFVYLKVLEWYK